MSLPDDDAPLPNESDGLGFEVPLPNEKVAFSLLLPLDTDPKAKFVAGAAAEPLEELFKKSKLGLSFVAAVSADDLNPPKPAKILGPPS